jgi:transposase-like protein
MPQAYSPELMAIERPRCPECQSRMMLSRVELGPAGSDLLTFDCLECDRGPNPARTSERSGSIRTIDRAARNDRSRTNHFLRLR